jgi:hypothetical protein
MNCYYPIWTAFDEYNHCINEILSVDPDAIIGTSAEYAIRMHYETRAPIGNFIMLRPRIVKQSRNFRDPHHDSSRKYTLMPHKSTAISYNEFMREYA